MLKGFKEHRRRCRVSYKAYRENKPQAVYTIRHDAAQLTVVRDDIFGNHDSHQMAWNAVNFVVAFKWDMFAIDKIAMRFMVDMEDGIEVDESMQGWNSLIDSLPAYLPGAKRTDEWWGKVAFPAFATNTTVIYKSPAYQDVDVLSALENANRPKPNWFVADIVLLGAILILGLFAADFFEVFHFCRWFAIPHLCAWVSFAAVLLHVGLLLFWLSRVFLVWEFYLPNKKKRRPLQIAIVVVLLGFYASLAMIGGFL